MRVQIVDPAAQTPPYDRSLCAALARAGADVELQTSHFVHGGVSVPGDYAVRELFYRRSSRLPSGSPARRAVGALEHVPGMLAHRRAAAGADVVHYQWLTLPRLDARLLPRERPLVLTAHGFLRADAGGGPGGGMRRALERMDAVVAHSRYGARRLHEEAGVAAERIHVIPHGAFDYLPALSANAALPLELAGAGERPVILAFGLIRPYKGLDVLLRAFAGMRCEAELWIVGRPLGVERAGLERDVERTGPGVRLVPRFVPDEQAAAVFRRADVVVLPYREVEQSGVLYTALAFGSAIIASDVGGFGEVAAGGDGGREVMRLVPPGDADALRTELDALVGDAAAREALGRAAAHTAATRYSWDAIAGRTLELYRALRAG